MPLDLYDIPEKPEDRRGTDAQGRPYICILFECCQVYARIYRKPDQLHYHGRCPKCLRTLHVRVGPQGTADRMFRAR